MALFRFHRSGLEESLRTTKVVKSLPELLTLLEENDIDYDSVQINPYPEKGSVDWRIGWYTHIVLIEQGGEVYPVGFLSESL